MQAVHIAELLIIDDLAPRKDIRSGAGRVVTLEAVRSVRLDLSADETIRMLFGVEIIQRTLEREEAGTETGEHHHEGGVPHEDIAVIGDIEVAAYETGIRFRGLDVTDADLPSLPLFCHFLL